MKPFEYIEDLEAIPVKESKFNISRIANMIPLHIEYENDGEQGKLIAYIDYETQTIEVTSPLPNGVSLDELKETILLFLRRRSLKYGLNIPMAPEKARMAGMPVDIPVNVREKMANVPVKGK